MFRAINLIEERLSIGRILFGLNVLLHFFRHLKFTTLYEEYTVNILLTLKKWALIPFIYSFLKEVNHAL